MPATLPSPEGAQNCTPNAAFGESVLRVGHCQWSFTTDGGSISTITAANNCTIPTNAVIYNCSINSTTACVGASGTMSFGLTAGGGSNTSFAGATAVASLGTNAKVQGTPVPQTASTWIKLTAPAQVNFTIATTPFSAGVVEVYVFYFVSST